MTGQTIRIHREYTLWFRDALGLYAAFGATVFTDKSGNKVCSGIDGERCLGAWNVNDQRGWLIEPDMAPK